MIEQHNVLTVGDLDFAVRVLKSEVPVVLEFTAEWCPHCHALTPIVERLSKEYAGQLRFAQLDVDEHPETPAYYGIQGMPTLLVFHLGKVIGRMVGPHPTRLQRSIEHILAENDITINRAFSKPTN